MVDNVFRLMTALEAEDELGAKYFYRQRTYRYQKQKKIKAFAFRGRQCFLPHALIGAYIGDLEEKLKEQFPELSGYKVFYDEPTKRVVVDGIFNRYIAVNADKETEEDLINKIKHIMEWVMAEGQEPDSENLEALSEGTEISVPEPERSAKAVDKTEDTPDVTSLSTSKSTLFPDDIQFVKVEADSIEGVPVRSYILISLPSVAQFIGVRSDNFSQWIRRTTFADYVVSAHYSKLKGTEISGPLKKGFYKGGTPLLPLELIPEVLVAIRQSGQTPRFPGRAEQLYTLAKETLEAVGLSIAGGSDKAAKILARVSEGMGVSAADQVIEIFKRYESRPFQVNTNLRFRGKVKSENKDYKLVTGQITIGVTGRPPAAWLALGSAKRLPSKNRTTGREVMRAISPEDSVGVTFSESHYIKDSSNMTEVIETGQQGKTFYKRLKDVGLLDD